MKILVTGGHITPALAFIDYANEKKADVHVIGRLTTDHLGKQASQEKRLFEEKGSTFYSFNQVKLNRHNKIRFIFNLPKLFVSFFKARRLVKKINPDVYLSFGGYLSLPVGFACYSLGIPIVIHEQTIGAGLANSIIARLAQTVCVSFKQSASIFPKEKTVVTGNILRKELYSNKFIKPHWFEKSSKKLLFITGGNQGSQFINDLIIATKHLLLKDYIIVHQTGSNKKSFFPKEGYYSFPWLDVSDIVWLMKHASIVICRSGANTVSELAILSTPSICIPLPYSQNNEQQKNAEWLADITNSISLRQEDISPQLFVSAIKELTPLASKPARKAKDIVTSKESVERVYQEVIAVVN